MFNQNIFITEFQHSLLLFLKSDRRLSFMKKKLTVASSTCGIYSLSISNNSTKIPPHYDPRPLQRTADQLNNMSTSMSFDKARIHKQIIVK